MTCFGIYPCNDCGDCFDCLECTLYLRIGAAANAACSSCGDIDEYVPLANTGTDDAVYGTVGTDSGDASAYMSNWVLNDVSRDNSDSGTLYGIFRKTVDTTEDTSVYLYSDAARTELVASYASPVDNVTGTVNLIEENTSGITGTVDLDSDPADADYTFEVSVDVTPGRCVWTGSVDIDSICATTLRLDIRVAINTQDALLEITEIESSTTYATHSFSLTTSPTGTCYDMDGQPFTYDSSGGSGDRCDFSAAVISLDIVCPTACYQYFVNPTFLSPECPTKTFSCNVVLSGFANDRAVCPDYDAVMNGTYNLDFGLSYVTGLPPQPSSGPCVAAETIQRINTDWLGQTGRNFGTEFVCYNPAASPYGRGQQHQTNVVAIVGMAFPQSMIIEVSFLEMHVASLAFPNAWYLYFIRRYWRKTIDWSGLTCAQRRTDWNQVHTLTFAGYPAWQQQLPHMDDYTTMTVTFEPTNIVEL